MRIIRALRLSKRSLLRLTDRANRLSTARDTPLFGLRPSEKIRTPDLMTPQGVSEASSLIIAHPMELVPSVSPNRYRILPRIAGSPGKMLFS